jgi:AcrR family transcriptional regulator
VAPRDTRTQLLNAAVRAINAGGEHSLNVRAIAKEAGVTVPSVYHFFGSREGLVEEAQAQRFEHGMNLVGIALDETLARATSKKKYQAAIKGWLSGITAASANSEFRKVRGTVLASAVTNKRLASRVTLIQEIHVRRVAGYLKYGIECGWLDSDLDVEAIIYWTVSQLNGRLVVELDPKKKFAKRWNDLFLESVFYALRLD